MEDTNQLRFLQPLPSKISFKRINVPINEYILSTDFPSFCSFSEIARIQSGGKPPGRDSKFVDIYHEKPIRLTVRALVPVKEHPKVSLRPFGILLP